MIIDSHTHIGITPLFRCRVETLLLTMDRDRIDYTVVSNIEAMEFDDDPRKTKPVFHTDSLTVNRTTLDAVRQYPDRFTGAYWIKPFLEPCSVSIRAFLTDHRDYFSSLKVHPFYSRLPVTDARYDDYFRLAQELHLPVCIHTASDEYSQSRFVYETAKRFPQIDFVMVHSGLNTDHRQSIAYCAELPNLYCETSWMDAESVLTAMQICGSAKVLFGSDSPIGGLTSYRFHDELFQRLGTECPKNWIKDLFYRNAKRVFGL